MPLAVGVAVAGVPAFARLRRRGRARIAPRPRPGQTLASERDASCRRQAGREWTRLEKATFLTANEKRTQAGYDPVSGGDELKRRPVHDLTRRFNPYHDELGRFTDAEGHAYGRTPDGTPVDAAQALSGYPVDLLEEEAEGGHTISVHVGKGPEELKARVRATIAEGTYSSEDRQRIRSGSFPSVEAANKLVNATISANKDIVDGIASGVLDAQRIEKEFGRVTGIEAYALSLNAQPRVRDTTAVGVFVRRDTSSPNGFRVISAYPRNLD